MVCAHAEPLVEETWGTRAGHRADRSLKSFLCFFSSQDLSDTDHTSQSLFFSFCLVSSQGGTFQTRKKVCHAADGLLDHKAPSNVVSKEYQPTCSEGQLVSQLHETATFVAIHVVIRPQRFQLAGFFFWFFLLVFWGGGGLRGGLGGFAWGTVGNRPTKAIRKFNICPAPRHTPVVASPVPDSEPRPAR